MQTRERTNASNVGWAGTRWARVAGQLRGLCLLAYAAGCANAEDASDELAVTTKQPAAYLGQLHVGGSLLHSMWDRVNGRYRIPVCFTPGNYTSNTVDRSPTDWAQDKIEAFSSLTTTWGANAPIDFINQGECGSNVTEDWIPITLAFDQSNPDQWPSRAVGPGRSARMIPCQGTDIGAPCRGCEKPCQVRINYGSNRYMFRDDVAHEVGHVLGLLDEHLRSDFPAPISCNGYTWPGAPADPTAVFLSASPDFASIMSAREASCFKLMGVNYGLSDGDKRSIAMLYPRTFDRGSGSVASWRGMYTAAGVVIREDGTATTDWYAQGAHSGLFNGGPSWTLYTSRGETHLSRGLLVSASYLARGSNDLGFSYVDNFGRNFTGRAPVIKSSALHTALALGAMGIL